MNNALNGSISIKKILLLNLGFFQCFCFYTILRQKHLEFPRIKEFSFKSGMPHSSTAWQFSKNKQIFKKKLGMIFNSSCQIWHFQSNWQTL